MDKPTLMGRVAEIAVVIAQGRSVAGALKKYYTRRYVVMPYPEQITNMSVDYVPFNVRGSNALMRIEIKTIGEFIERASDPKWYRGIHALGKTTVIDMLETLLDFVWDFMDTTERAQFLIDFVIDNQDYYLGGIAKK